MHNLPLLKISVIDIEPERGSEQSGGLMVWSTCCKAKEEIATICIYEDLQEI